MTKYVLSSGGNKKYPEAATKYFAEVLDGLGNHPKVLWCFFATLPGDMTERFEKYTELFEGCMPEGVSPLHKNTSQETFVQDVQWADAIYLHGGLTSTLREALDRYDIDQIFRGKSVGLTSASSLIMCDTFWGADSRQIKKGYAKLPLKFIAHFKSDYGSDDPRGPIDWEAAYEELKDYGDTSLPVHALEEGQYIVFNTKD